MILKDIPKIILEQISQTTNVSKLNMFSSSSRRFIFLFRIQTWLLFDQIHV